MPTYIPNKIAISDSYTFDDVLLLPNYSNFLREEISFEIDLHPTLRLKLPILSSPMDTVTTAPMAIQMAQAGGLGIIHRAMSVEEQCLEIQEVKSIKPNSPKATINEKNELLVGVALGVGPDFEAQVEKLVEAGADLLVLDTAHGHAEYIINGIKQIKAKFNIPIMAGNIATFEAARDLGEAGADILRVGMGPGSICTTRIVTGMGVPQLTAVSEVSRYTKAAGKTVIADGGIKQIGDIPKAMGFGADCVMLGSMLAGFDESPGERMEINGEMYKTYRGMGSIGAMTKNGGSRYGQNATNPKQLVAEGVEGLVKLKGTVADLLFQIEGGLRSAFYYIGAKNMSEFYDKARFVKITSSGLKESHPHTINLTSTGDSYL